MLTISSRNFKHREYMMTLPFTNDQVIITNSKHNLWKVLYQIYKQVIKYENSDNKSKLTVFQERMSGGSKIIRGDKIIHEINTNS